jgi:Flp pilus assembly protein TadD
MAKLPDALTIVRRKPQPSGPHRAELACRQAVHADADELVRLGAACSIPGQFGEATTRVQQVLRPGPHQAAGHKGRGTALARQGDLGEPVVGFQQALRLQPDRADFPLNPGHDLRGQGRLDEAVTNYLQDSRLEPDSPEVHYSLGVALERQGRLEEAATSYEQALRLQPVDPEAHNNLGIVLARLGRLDEAAARFRQAVALKPDYPDAHNNLGNILERQDKLDEAVACYHQALGLKPRYAEAHYNLGIVLARQEKPDEAVASYRQAVALKPDYADAYNNLGSVLSRQGKHDEAVASYRQAVALKPDDPGHHNNLGLILARHDRLDEAAESYEQALRLTPDDPEVHNNLGIVLGKLNRLDEAAARFWQALGLKPDHAEAHNNLGSVLEKQDKLEQATACYHQALGLKPGYPEAHNNLGIVLWKQGRLEEAVASYGQALHFQPDYPEANWNRSLAWLTMGRLEQGWPGYEWRFKCKEFGSLPPFQAPLWDGSLLDGRTILIHAEQGLGDTLQFIRYVPLVHQRGGRVILMCQPPLVRLLARSPGIERLLAHGDPVPESDVHVSLLSLPGLFGTTLESVPADVPYIEAEPALVEAWRQRLAAPGFKVGIAWQGNPKFRQDRNRSIPLAQFAPLAQVPGVRLLSLQKGREQLPALRGLFPVTDLGGELDEATGPFLDTAAVMKNLDLVVTSDTSIAHLAGALGVPVWVALQDVPDWRWLMDREDSPWYPTMRLFRQTKLGQWADVFDRIAEALRRQMAAPTVLRPITVEIAPGELIDKITILEIKSERIIDANQLHHVGTELALLVAARECTVPGSAELTRLETELNEVNEALWQIEDEIRLCERCEEFGPQFVALARSVYHTNDRRAALKRQINELLRSDLMEEKSYAPGAEPTHRQELQGIGVARGA